jgi:uncharacterized protein GlcG (DUF336 family)
MDIDRALAIIAHGRASAEDAGTRMSFAVADPAGRLVALARMNDAPYFTAQIAIAKACTAASTGVNTADLAAAMGEATSFAIAAAVATRGEFILAGGGVPILDGDAVVGGLGASGGTPDQDRSVAEHAVAAG